MAVPGDPYDDCLVELYEHALSIAGAPLEFFDAHTHLGENDPDGRKATAQKIVSGLDRAGHRRALIFAMQEPAGYADANAAAIDAARASDGRLIALARINPPDAAPAVTAADKELAPTHVGSTTARAR